MSINYTEFKRERVSACNICREIRELTWDHIPPQGSISLGAFEQQNLFDQLTVKPGERHYTISQNGIKFRTLCATYNNRELEKKLGPVLNDFSKQVCLFLKLKLGRHSRWMVEMWSW